MSRPDLIPVAVSSGAPEELGLGYDADSPGLSADGRVLVFASEDPALSDEDRQFRHRPAGRTDRQPGPRHLRLRPGDESDRPGLAAQRRERRGRRRQLEPAGDLRRRPLRGLRHRIPQPDSRQGHRRRRLRPRPAGQDDDPRLAARRRPRAADPRLRTVALGRRAARSPSSGRRARPPRARQRDLGPRRGTVDDDGLAGERRATAPSRTPTAANRPSPRTAATSPSPRRRRTWSAATTRGSRTSSSAT